MEIVRGPMNFSTNDECGLLIEGFNESPMIMMPYNPEYYIDLIERYGFLKAMDLYAYSLKGNPPERLIRFFNKISDKTNIKIRKIDMKRFYEEIDRIMDIYNSAWEKNWGFIPLTDKEIRYHAIRLKKIADPNLILFAEVDNTHVGFISAIPNINPVLKKINGNLFPFGIFKYIYYSRKIDSVRVITLGIIRDYRNMGIDSLLILELWKRGIDGGYRFGEMSWILESNILMRRGIEKIGGLPYKRYRIYELKL
jgi:ribosomal protein S18 acetylase RimI-like enzyme